MPKPPSLKPAAKISSRKTLRVGLMLYAGCLPAGLLVISDVLRAVNRRLGSQRFATTWLSAEPTSLHTHDGLQLQAAQDCQAADCDVVVVPGFWSESAADIDAMLHSQQPLIAQLRSLPARTAVWSYCMGVALVAASGRLDGCTATATWWQQQHLRDCFAQVAWQPHQSVVVAKRSEMHSKLRNIGKGNSLISSHITAAAANGYLALVLEVLRAEVPPAVLSDVQHLLLLPHPATVHPAFAAVDLSALQDPLRQRLLGYAQATPASLLDVAGAAEVIGVSARTLSRRMDAASSVSAGAWLRLVKLKQVGDRLASSRLPAKAIAQELGFSDEAAMHRAFKQVTGLTLLGYRQAYSRGLS